MASFRAMGDELTEGLYEALLTSDLRRTLSTGHGLAESLAKVDPEDHVHVLTHQLATAATRRLDAVRDPAKRLELANTWLATIAGDGADVLDPIEQLHALRPPDTPGMVQRYRQRPRTPLNDAALLTNAHGEPSLAAELRAELDSANSVDLLCAFVMWHGLRLLEAELSALKDAGVPLRVITTTYIGGTERRALDRLVREFGAEVKVQYDAARTRLHAKAWIFHRNTGYDTAYVGSSNLTTSAMLEGVEWNVRLSTAATPALIQKFRATFDSYWNSSEFGRTTLTPTRTASTRRSRRRAAADAVIA
jgi:HKD family nuclease